MSFLVLYNSTRRFGAGLVLCLLSDAMGWSEDSRACVDIITPQGKTNILLTGRVIVIDDGSMRKTRDENGNERSNKKRKKRKKRRKEKREKR